MDTSKAQYLAQILGPTISLITAGGILSISSFITPILDNTARSISTPTPSASSTLPAIRFIFSRGSHVFPQAAILAASNFFYLAYYSTSSSAIQSLGVTQKTAFLVAGLLSLGIGPVTGVMLPLCNNRLREMAEMERRGEGGKVDEGELKRMVRRFRVLNYVRGGLIAVGGVVGLVAVVG